MEFITVEEFDSLYNELVQSEFTCYDRLISITDKVLKNFVKKQCYDNLVLRGKGYEEDIMQEVRLKVLKNCVHGFFRRNGEDNYNPSGFVAWLFTVSKNVIYDYAKKVRSYQFNEVKDIDDCYNLPSENDLYVFSEATDELNVAIKIVFDSDRNVYAVLTWVAMMVFMVNLNIEKFETPEMIDKAFSQKTLYQMYDTILMHTERIPWLELGEDRKMYIKSRLDASFKDGRCMGDMMYGDFYMKKGPKATISDWVNRMNKYIVKEVLNNVTLNS